MILPFLFCRQMPQTIVWVRKVRVIRFLSKSLIGAQLNWSTIEKEFYGLYWAVKMLEEYLDNRRFILKTDQHKNLTYINKTGVEMETIPTRI